MGEALIGEVRGAADSGRLCMRGRFARDVHFYTDGTAEADFGGVVGDALRVSAERLEGWFVTLDGTALRVTVGGGVLTDGGTWQRDARCTVYCVTANLRMRVSGGTGIHELYAVAHEVREV